MFMKATLPAALFCAMAVCAPVQAAPLCVKASEANLRQGPGTNYGKTWKVYKYMPLSQVGRQGSWYEVKDVDGDRHWIYANLVSSSLRCAVVKVDKANMRSGPGTGHAQTEISPVEKYYSFRVLERKGDWVKVRDEVDNVGWISSALLWLP